MTEAASSPSRLGYRLSPQDEDAGNFSLILRCPRSFGAHPGLILRRAAGPSKERSGGLLRMRGGPRRMRGGEGS
jgi:hypothetical protein